MNLNKKSISQIVHLNHVFNIMLSLLFLSFFGCNDNKTKAKTTQNKPAIVESEERETKSDKKVVLFYGDSLTAGYGLEEDQAFPSLIEDKIDSLGLPYTIVNAGLSGETTSGGLKRIDWVMKQKVDIFFLELGANDMLRGLPLKETRKNLLEIISKVKAKNPNVQIAICEMLAPPNMGEKYVSEFSKLYKDLSLSADIALVPFFLEGVAGNSELLLKDGKHPNAAGQVIVAENIWKSLKNML